MMLDGVPKEHRNVQQVNPQVANMAIDIGKHSFHVVGLDRRGAIVLHQNGRAARLKANSCVAAKGGHP